MPYDATMQIGRTPSWAGGGDLADNQPSHDGRSAKHSVLGYLNQKPGTRQRSTRTFALAFNIGMVMADKFCNRRSKP